VTSHRWIVALIVVIALVEPVTHFALEHTLSGDSVHSGFHIGDTPFFLTSMRAFGTGFVSPYTTDASVHGDASARYFALPHHALYGALGMLARTIHVAPFIVLGVANGLAAAAYLGAVLVFFRALCPVIAARAFAIFTLGGGLAGVVWLIAFMLNHANTAPFETWFHRFARYELIEGPFLSPWLLLPRLYYTLPLALGYVALARTARRGAAPDIVSVGLLTIATYLNLRAGTLLLGATIGWFLLRPGASLPARVRACGVTAAPVIAAGAIVAWLWSWNPIGGENVSSLLRRSAWFGSVAAALVLFLPGLVPGVHAGVRALPRWARIVAGGALGYLFVFGALYLAHQIYYGNFVAGGEASAAARVSDVSLLGAILGAALGARRRDAEGDPALGWLTLWFVAGIAASVSAFGAGWAMRLMPERCLVLLGPPLALLTAHGLAIWQPQRPRLNRAALGALLACGTTSALVGVSCFQGPLGHRPDTPAFAWAHSEQVYPEDAAIVADLTPGLLLAPASLPPLVGDVAVHRNESLSTVLGQPTLEFAGLNMLDTIRAVQAFYDPAATTEARAEFVARHGIDYVLCPREAPVADTTLAQFEATPWLVRHREVGPAIVYRVTRRAPVS